MSTLGDFIALQRCFASNNKDILQRKRHYQEPQKRSPLKHAGRFSRLPVTFQEADLEIRERERARKCRLKCKVIYVATHK